jgi:hypothetical protein
MSHPPSLTVVGGSRATKIDELLACLERDIAQIQAASPSHADIFVESGERLAETFADLGVSPNWRTLVGMNAFLTVFAEAHRFGRHEREHLANLVCAAAQWSRALRQKAKR